jgi:hypothetical protein
MFRSSSHRSNNSVGGKDHFVTLCKILTAVVVVCAVGMGTSVASFGISATAARSYSCVTSAKRGSCVFPQDTKYFSGIDPGRGRPESQALEIDQDVWNAASPDCTGWSQKERANSAEDFQVAASYPAGNTAVCAYPNVWPHDAQGAVDGYSQITSTFSESFPHNGSTHAWGMFDLWFNNWANEVMVQYDFSNNAPCPTTPITDKVFGGTSGVPSQSWFLCTLTSPEANGTYKTMAWKLGTDQTDLRSESSGSIDILAMIKYLEKKGYLPARSTWTAISMGWEICSTGGRTETFTGSGFTVKMVSAQQRHERSAIRTEKPAFADRA